MTITVAIVEDNNALRDGLHQLLQGTAGFKCVGVFANAELFLSQAESLRSHVVLMDIGLPGMSGIEAVQRLKTFAPETAVMMLTVYEDDKRIFDAICAGASGYLLKKTPPAKLLDAIRELHHGGAPMTARVARRVLAMFQDLSPKAPPHSRLSNREREVLSALVEGLSYKMIADRCSISIDTVRTHVKHIYEKLHVNSKGQAITLAIKTKLV